MYSLLPVTSRTCAHCSVGIDILIVGVVGVDNWEKSLVCEAAFTFVDGSEVVMRVFGSGETRRKKNRLQVAASSAIYTWSRSSFIAHLRVSVRAWIQLHGGAGTQSHLRREATTTNVRYRETLRGAKHRRSDHDAHTARSLFPGHGGGGSVGNTSWGREGAKEKRMQRWCGKTST